MPSDKPLIHFVTEKEFLDKVDDYRFEHRFKSRASAMRFLMRWALEQNPQPSEEDQGDD